MIIYKTTNLINGKIYVGQDSNDNDGYLGSGVLLKKAIKKYGKENFIKEVLVVCETLDELDLNEVLWISKLSSQDRSIGYNVSCGGKEGDRSIGHRIIKDGIYDYWIGRYGVVEADKKKSEQYSKLSEYNKKHGTQLTKKGRYVIWVERYGVVEADRLHTEWRKKISDYQQKKVADGWSHTESTKSKISESSKGRKMSEETKEKLRKPKPVGFGDKISKSNKNRVLGPSKKRIIVEQYSLGGELLKTWDSITQAEKELKIHNISNVCKGKQKTAGGCKWKYKN